MDLGRARVRMSLVRIYSEMQDNPRPQNFHGRGRPRWDERLAAKKKRSVGHRSRTGSRASAPLPSRTRKDSTYLWTRSIRRTSSPRPQLLSAPARVAELRSSPPSYELRSGPPPHALAPAPALLRSAATRARRRRKRSVAELAGGGSAQWLLLSSGQRRPMAVGGRARGGGRKRHGAGVGRKR